MPVLCAPPSDSLTSGITDDADPRKPTASQRLDDGRPILLRTGTGPRWLGLTGFVVAIVMVLDAQRVDPWIALAFPSWVLVLGLFILAASFRRTPDLWRERGGPGQVSD